MEFQFLFGNPTKKRKPNKGGTMAKVKRVRSRSTLTTKAKANPRKQRVRRRRKNPEKLILTKADNKSDGTRTRLIKETKAYPTKAEFDKIKKTVSARSKQVKTLERGLRSLSRGKVGTDNLKKELGGVQRQLRSSKNMTPTKWNSLSKKEESLLERMKSHKEKVSKHILSNKAKVQTLLDQMKEVETQYAKAMKQKQLEAQLAKKNGFRVSGKVPVSPNEIKKLQKALLKAKKELSKEEVQLKRLLTGKTASGKKSSATGFTKKKRKAKAASASKRTITKGSFKKKAKKKTKKKVTKKKNPILASNPVKKKKKVVRRKKAAAKKTKKKVVRKKASRKKASRKKVSRKKVVSKKNTSKKKVARKKVSSKKKVTRKASKKRTTRKASKKKSTGLLSLANAKSKLGKLLKKGGLGKGRKKTIKTKANKRRYDIMVKRTNPSYSLIESKKEGLSGMVQSYLQSDVQEMVGFAIGGFGHGLTNDMAVKLVGDVLGQRALLARVASMPMGDAVFPLMGIGIFGHVALKFIAPKVGLSKEYVSKIIKGWAAATIVGTGIKAYDMVAPSIFSHRAGAGMSGVDYTPMSGVDYTPMSGVDYTPMGSDFYGEDDYMGSLSVVDAGLDSESSADFGMEESPADFGMEDDMGSDFY